MNTFRISLGFWRGLGAAVAVKLLLTPRRYFDVKPSKSIIITIFIKKKKHMQDAVFHITLSDVKQLCSVMK